MLLNGEFREGCEGKTLRVLLAEEEYNIKQVAVEINGEIIPRQKLPETVVHEEDQIEVVSFVGGG